ncbi:tumor necrosis factor receptor superfamily member 18 [Porphyrio hochstetteri]
MRTIFSSWKEKQSIHLFIQGCKESWKPNRINSRMELEALMYFSYRTEQERDREMKCHYPTSETDISSCLIKDNDCKCKEGQSCADSDCSYCRDLPVCVEGQELVKRGYIDFTFKCEPCKTGTYSNVKNGPCRNWTDCESSGFLTIKQGNSTHNTICGFPPKDLEQAPLKNDSMYITILAILTAVAVFVLILLTFFLHFCIWSLKKEKYPSTDNLEHNFTRLLGVPQLPQHREETYSCQFPEEEHGDKTPEEKTCYFHPHSLQWKQIITE